jgi:hypothetical protein
MLPTPPSTLSGLLLVRGAGAPLVQRRLPGRSAVTVGRRERNGLVLTSEWAPLDAARLTPVEEGWLVTNGARTRMSVSNDWIHTGTAFFLPGAAVMLQRGEHRLAWPELPAPLSLMVTVRSRRMDDQRLCYAVDGAVGTSARSGPRSAVEDPPMSAALRYRLAVLFGHLLLGAPAPANQLRRRAEFLLLEEQELEELAHRYRRRVNGARGTDLQTVEELGEHLVATGELTRADLDP